MKTLISLILFSATAAASEPSAAFLSLKKPKDATSWNDRIRNERDLGGAGEMPIVRADYLPGYISAAIQRRGDESEVVSWTLPTLESTTSAGRKLGWWKVTVKTRLALYDVAIIGSVVQSISGR